jgi:hypothetical protein
MGPGPRELLAEDSFAEGLCCSAQRDGMPPQGGFADSGLTSDGEKANPMREGGIECINAGLFALSPDDLRGAISRRNRTPHSASIGRQACWSKGFSDVAVAYRASLFEDVSYVLD